MQFLVRALDRQQQVLSLSIEALDEADARGQLQARALQPLAVSAQRRWSTGRSAFDLLLFAQELHALLTAGLSVIECLDVLAEKEASAEARTTLERVCRALREGERLSSALGRQPSAFPPLFVGIVQAAEGTSNLPQSLGRYIEYETRLAAVRHRVVSAAIYPAVLLLVGGAVSLFLLGYVVPRFAAVYQGGGRELPWASQLLLSWGGFAGQHLGALATLFAGAVGAAAWWVRRQWQRGGLSRALALLPTARPRLRLLELSRLYLTLGMLIEGGIAVTRALSLSGAVVSPHNQAALEQVRARVEGGLPFSESLDAAGLSTPIAQRLLRVGEQSGQLGAMLTRTANFYDGETARWIDRFSRLFEPLLMAAIGVVIGLIVVLLYMPVFDLAGGLQ